MSRSSSHSRASGVNVGRKAEGQLIHDLQNNNPALTTDHAALFVAISAKYYCPQLTKNPVGAMGTDRTS
jgi:hypothetical protein